MTHPPTNNARDEEREGTGSAPKHAPTRPEMPALPNLDSTASPAEAFHASAAPTSAPRSGPSDQASFRPTSYAGQTHTQYGQPSRPDAVGPAYGRPQSQHFTASTYPHPLGNPQHAGPQPGQHAPQQTPEAKDKKRGRGARATVVILSLLLPIGIAAGVFAGYTYASQLGSFDTQAVEREVVSVLRDDYGLSDLSEVECPDWIQVEQGESFQCEFEYAGSAQTVTVTQGSQSGQLVVGAPE